jgi:peptidoglycan/xylan/chitin deacetylase (PgdA/CDA1 family)
MDRLGLGRLVLGRTWRGVVTLSYHRVATDWTVSPSPPSATVETLSQQLRLLRDHCELLTPDRLTEEALTSHGRRVIVTVDDCYRDSYELAFPAFAANRVPATLFLVSGFLDGTAQPWWDEIAWMVASSKRNRLDPAEWWDGELPLQGGRVAHTLSYLIRLRRGMSPQRGGELLDHLAAATGSGRRPPESARREFITWEQAREMLAGEMAFGGHTDTHPVLTTLSQQEQRAEIERGLDRIEAELGARPTTFAYPVGLQGTFDSSTKAAAAAAGVRLAFSNYGGYTRRRNWDPLEIRRVGVSRDTSDAAFRWTIGLPSVFAREWSPGRFQLDARD